MSNFVLIYLLIEEENITKKEDSNKNPIPFLKSFCIFISNLLTNNKMITNPKNNTIISFEFKYSLKNIIPIIKLVINLNTSLNKKNNEVSRDFKLSI